MATPDADTVARHLPLHPLELRILLVLAEGPAHGYRIVKAVEARAGDGRRLFPANLYRRIRTLTERGLVADADGAVASEDGRSRRTLALTPLGRAVARAEAGRLAELVDDARRVDLLEPA